MRSLLFSFSLLVGCMTAASVYSRTLDLDVNGMSGITTDGLGAGSGVESMAILRGQKVAEAITAMVRELEARGDYHTILSIAPEIIELVPGNILLRHLHALSLAAAGEDDAARQVLEEFPETADDSGWGVLARALILRSDGALKQATELTTRVIENAPENAYAHNLAGTIAFAQNLLDPAGYHFAKAAALQPGSDTYLGNLGAVERMRGNRDAAVTALQTALQINPSACSARINYAGVLRDTGDLVGAQTQLESCLNAEPGNSFAIRHIIEILAERRQYDMALTLARLHTDSLVEASTTKARLALLLGDPELAKKELATAVPGPGTDLLAAFAAAGRGDLEQAQDLVRALVDLLPERPDIAPGVIGFLATGGAVETELNSYKPDKPSIAYIVGLSAAISGDEEMMRNALVADAPDVPGLALTGYPAEQIRGIVASPATPWLVAALTHAQEGYHKLSYAAALRATEADPDLALAQVVRARAAAELREEADMLASLEKALSLAPAGVEPHLQRGEAAMAMGDLSLAVHHFEQVLNIADNASAALRLGLVSERMGDDASAEAAYERLILMTPNSFIGYNQLAWFLAERERDLDRALVLAEKANVLMPDNASIQDTIGWILHLQGNTSAGVTYLRRSFDIAGWEIPVIGLHLAQAEMTLGNQESARELLSVLGNRPENDYYGQKAREILEQF